jgi:hypothetical protein
MINSIRKIASWSTVVVALLLIHSCTDLEYDNPPVGGADPNLPVNATIAQLKAKHTLGQYEEITEDLTVAALVVSNDEAGNFFKQLEVQDSSGGIEMRIDVTDLHAQYPVGRKIYIKAKGLWLGDYNGLIQLGAGLGTDASGKPELIRIPESILANYVKIATYGNPVVPKVKTIDQVSYDDVSTLIQLNDVQFITSDTGVTYADAVLQQTLNLDIEDCSRTRIIVRTSGYSTFANELTPSGGGSIVGVLSIFGATYQLMIRDLNDVSMNGPRCAVNQFTTSSLRQLFAQGTTTVPGGTLTGTVISDYNSLSVTGRNLYLQDATGGIVLRYTANHTFNLGDQISVDVSGGTMGEFNGLLQIDGLDNGATSVVSHTGDVTPRNATVLEVLNNAQAWESTLVKISKAVLTDNTIYSGSVTVTDKTGSMVLFTRSQSTFANEALPTDTVSVTAILSDFNAPQLIIRNSSDVTGGGSSGGTDIDESFTSIADNADVILPGWANIAVKGTRLWRGKVFSGNHYAQATSFQDVATDMESWLITPPIVLDVAKKITFESAYAFLVQDGLTIWISSDFDGANVTGATWTQLHPTVASSTDPENTFIPSGIIDLSSYTGPVRVGFKYVGSGPGGQTSTFRVDNVKVEKL